MFRNIGDKIKLLAKIYACVSPVVVVVAALSLISTGSAIALAFLVGGVLLFSLAWPLYGFGQLVQDVHGSRDEGGRMNLQEDDLPNL